MGHSILAWEVTLAVWLIVKGFNSSVIVSEPDKIDTNQRDKMSLSKA